MMKPRIKIMKTGPHVTEQEVRQFMDFDALLKRREQTLNRHRKLNRVRNIFTGMIALMIIPVIIILTRHAERNDPLSSDQEETSLPWVEIPVDSAQMKVSAPDPEQPASGHTVDTTAAYADGFAEPNNPVDQEQMHNRPAIKQRRIDAPSGYVQAEPVDGYAALYTYFDEALKYPTVAASNSVEGVMTVAFMIDVNGKVKKVMIENSLGEAFDQEIRRLIDHMPAWRPATYNGNPVDSKVSLPITFSLEKHTNP